MASTAAISTPVHEIRKISVLWIIGLVREQTTPLPGRQAASALIGASVAWHYAEPVVRVGWHHSGGFTPLLRLHEHYVYPMHAGAYEGLLTMHIDI